MNSENVPDRLKALEEIEKKITSALNNAGKLLFLNLINMSTVYYQPVYFVHSNNPDKTTNDIAKGQYHKNSYCFTLLALALQELGKDRPMEKNVEKHSASYMKALEEVETDMLMQINYLTQIKRIIHVDGLNILCKRKNH
uniref:uncharacterized protein LOC120331797 isoform X2 n=1 Tax=Styela clava TaxID=7725 RepID=UPI001939B2DC|nr:uncharacterized protein LOC120331797 isoform X2 [Styela clava]